MNEIQTKNCPEIKVSRDEQHLYVEGYGAYYGNKDRYADVIAPGAFAEFLASEDAKRAVLCWQHDFSQPIGAFEDLHEDEKGLWFRAKIANTQQGRDAAELVEAGVLNEFSIGYGVKEAEYPQDDPDGVQRILKNLYLYEISIVTRAANPKATLTGTERKEEDVEASEAPAPEPEAKEEDTPNTNQNLTTAMEEELKTKVAELEQKLAAIEGDTKTEEAIRNLDESVQKLHEEMKAQNAKQQTAGSAICEAIKSDEFKSLVKDVVDGKRASGRMEVKLDTSAMTGTVLRSLTDSNVYADAQKKLVFVDSIRKKDVPQDKSVIVWVEGSFTDNTNYVNEGSAIGSADGASASEVTRGLAKIGAKLPFTREVATDLGYFLNWAREEAIAAIRNKVDYEILNGSGADTNSSTKKLIYGIIGQGSTAFNATTAGCAGKFTAPALWQLIDAIDAQIDLGTNGAFVADTIYMHPSDFAIYKNMKDANGRLLFEYTNGGFYVFLGKRVVTTSKLSAGSLLVADTSIWDLYEKLGFEIEIERVASTDSYVMYLRWRGQLVTPSNKKKGAIYVASIATALAAIAKGSGSGSGSGQG
jgi:hypothetical protein